MTSRKSLRPNEFAPGMEGGTYTTKMRSGWELPASLKSAQLFHGVPDAYIHKIFENALYHDFPAQHFLYKQGQPARNVFLLESGLISLTEITAAGDETLIRFVFPGDGTGLVDISDIHEYLLSAQALKATRVLTWDRATAFRLLREIPSAATNLLSIAIADVIHYYHYIRRLKMDPLEHRIEWALNEVSRAIGKPTREGITIERGGYRFLAQLAGTNIYSISRELSKLERLGVLRKYRGRVVLLDANDIVGFRSTAG